MSLIEIGQLSETQLRSCLTGPAGLPAAAAGFHEQILAQMNKSEGGCQSDQSVFGPAGAERKRPNRLLTLLCLTCRRNEIKAHTSHFQIAIAAESATQSRILVPYSGQAETPTPVRRPQS
jgi:hypothetical protein